MPSPYDPATFGKGYWFDQYVDHCDDNEEAVTEEGFWSYMSDMGEEADQRKVEQPVVDLLQALEDSIRASMK